MVVPAPCPDEGGALWELEGIPLLPFSGDALIGCWCRSVTGGGFEQAACVGVEPAMGLLLEMPRKASDESLLEVRCIATDAEICPFLAEPGWSQFGQGVEFNGHVSLVVRPLSRAPGSAHTDRDARTERGIADPCAWVPGASFEEPVGVLRESPAVTHVAMDRGTMQVQIPRILDCF